MLLFELFIHPTFTDLNKIQKNFVYFFKYKNYLARYKILVYTKFKKKDFNLSKFHKLNIEFHKIDDTISGIKELWTSNMDNYNDYDWVIHYDVRDRLLEFDFIKMIFKKSKNNTFVKKNMREVYDNLFCINFDLMVKFILSKNNNLDPNFIMTNSNNYYFLKYMNIITKNDNGDNIYI